MTLEQSEAVCVIRLEGGIDIASAAELKTLLLQALASGRELRADLEAATELDITAVQLLWAAEREAGRSGRKFTLAGRVLGAIRAAVRDAGLEKVLVGGDGK